MEAPAGGASCVAAPRWGACKRVRRTRSAAVALRRLAALAVVAVRDHGVEHERDGRRPRRARRPHAPAMTSVRRRPRRRGARTKTDRPQREQRSRSERSSKPQCGHVRDGTSVIVGGIGLTSVDIVTGFRQSLARGSLRRRPASPRGARPRRGAWPRAGFPQYLLGPRRRRRGVVVLACGLWRLARGARLRRRRARTRPRARARTARGAAGAVPGQPRRGARRRRWPSSTRRACGRAGAPR